MTTPNMGSASSPGIGHPDDPMTQIALQGIVRAGTPAIPSLAAAPQIASQMNRNNVVPMTLSWAGTPPQSPQVGGGLYTAQELGRMDPQTRQETMTQLDPSLLDAQARRSAGDAIVAGMAHNQAAHLWAPQSPPPVAPVGRPAGEAPLQGLLWYALGPFLRGMKGQTESDRQASERIYSGEPPAIQANQRRAFERRADEFYSVGAGEAASKSERAAMKAAGEPVRIPLHQVPVNFGPSQRHRQPYPSRVGGSDSVHDFPITVEVGGRPLHIGAFSRTQNTYDDPQRGPLPGPASWHFNPAPNVLIQKYFDPPVLVPKFVDWLRSNNMDSYAMEFAARPPQAWWTR